MLSAWTIYEYASWNSLKHSRMNVNESTMNATLI